MASKDGGRPRSRPGVDSERTQIEDAGRRRPFMRGIMVHSLMARGVGFDLAYETANRVRQRIRGRGVVPRAELAGIVHDLLGDASFREDNRVPLPVDITVTGGRGRGLPFSKGVLSQSLLAAAIDPNDAFDVARQIEQELVRRDAKEIDRHELRGLAYDALSRQIGSEAAERYLVWRRFQEPDRPVLLLLGGSAGVGKTTLALEVAHRLGIGRVLSTDSIRQIMRVMLSRDLVPAVHGSSYEGARLLPVEALVDDPVIEGFRAQTAAVSLGVRASMDRAVAENASMVLDGVSLVPGLLDLEPYAELAHVVFLVVSSLDEDALRNRFEARGAGDGRRAGQRYLEQMDAILSIQDHILELAERHHVPIVDNVSFDRSVLLIIRHVAETLRKKNSLEAVELR